VCLFVRVSVCVFLCLSTFISGTRCPVFNGFFSACYLLCGSVLLWQRCDIFCIYGFVDDVMFSHNVPHGGMSIPSQRRRCSVMHRLTPLLCGVSGVIWILSYRRRRTTRVLRTRDIGGEVCDAHLLFPVSILSMPSVL